MDTNDMKASISIDCSDGPQHERFKATILTYSAGCDVVAKAEQLIRVSSVSAFRTPRDIDIIYRTEGGRIVTGRYHLTTADMTSRGFLSNFCQDLLNRHEVMAS